MTSLRDIIPLKLAEFSYPKWHPGFGTPGVVYGYAIRTPRGIVLFDTGIGPPHPEIDPEYSPRRTSLEAALSAHDISREGVVAVVNSHLHFDHCGENRLFPRLPIYVQRTEREASRARHYTVPEWVEFPEAKYRLLDGDAEVQAGVRAIATPGHTAGHQSLLIYTDQGPVLLAGHAIRSVREYTALVPPEEESAEGNASAARLRSFSPVRAYFSHDPGVYSHPIAR